MAKPVKHYGKWRIRWIDAKGERCSATIDDFKTAAFLLRRHETEAEEIRRGLRESPIATAKTFAELAAYWIEHRASRKRNPKDDQSIIRVHLIPAFGDLKLQEIGVEAVDRFRTTKIHLHPKTLSNILTLFISMSESRGGVEVAGQSAGDQEASTATLRGGLQLPSGR